jgi:MFS family permease
MFQDYHKYLLHFDFLKNVKLIEIYINIALTTLSFSLVGLFIPIYLYSEVGYSFEKVMYFMIIYVIMTLFGFYFALKSSQMIGLNKTVALSVPLRIIYMVLLALMIKYNVSMYLVTFFGALGMSMYWLPFHVRFSESSDGRKRGSEVGLMYTINGLFAISGPIMGGLIVTFLGFSSLYIITSIILGLSLIPMFMIKEEKIKEGIKIKNILKGKSYKELLGYFGEGYRGDGYILWSFYLFLILGSYITLGGISSGVIFFNSILHLFVGYLVDVFGKRKIIKIGSFIDSLTWFTRLFFHSLYSLFAVTALSGLAIATWFTPFAAKFYDKFSKEDGISHMLFREWALALGRIMIFLFALIFGLKWSILSVGVVLFFIWIYE